MNYKTTTLLLGLFMIFAGCSDSQTQKTAEVKSQESIKIEKKIKTVVAPVKEIVLKKEYTIEEIYNSMCIECHSADGTGNTEKLTPSMATLSEDEMRESLEEVEKDQGHIIMEHNRGEILKMGMKYSAEDMAKYMFHRFSKK